MVKRKGKPKARVDPLFIEVSDEIAGEVYRITGEKPTRSEVSRDMALFWREEELNRIAMRRVKRRQRRWF